MISLGQIKEAKNLLQNTTWALGVKNLDFEEKIKSLQILIKEQEFFACIEKEDEINKLSADKLVVEKDYQGPVIEEDTELSLEFVREIISFLA